MVELEYEVRILGGSLHQTRGYGPTHPAANALAMIGKPAADEAHKRLAFATDPEKERHTDPSEKENLSKALGLVDEMAGQ